MREGKHHVVCVWCTREAESEVVIDLDKTSKCDAEAKHEKGHFGSKVFDPVVVQVQRLDGVPCVQ